MKFDLKTSEISKISADALILPYYADKGLTQAGKKVNSQAGDALSNLIENSPVRSDAGQYLLLNSPNGVAAKSIILISVGNADELTADKFRLALKTALVNLSQLQLEHIAIAFDIKVKGCQAGGVVQHALESIHHAAYRFDHYKSQKHDSFKRVTVVADSKQKISTDVKYMQALCDGMTLTKDLANSPANVCTPTYLANEAKKLAKTYSNLKVNVIEEAEMKKLGMGALLSVSQGSDEPAKLIIVQYQGAAKSQAPVALVGKGVTFDTGGNCIKPAGSMVGMKYDMTGAATVLGTIKAAAEQGLRKNIVGVIAATENMINGKASRPEDIVTTMSGQTVEIINTDAEGRLILCDALTYVERFKPKAVINLATLTGAMVITLGNVASGIFTNNQQLANALLKASEKTRSKLWQLPLWDEYQSDIDSPFADMANVGNGRGGGSIHAACFLSRFTKNYPWVHIDMSSGAIHDGVARRYATGHPIPALLAFLNGK
ncbi:MAG: leucyl aminopeptidase [Gammaproteobacteria bacterium]